MKNLYDRQFYMDQRGTSTTSARILVPTIRKVISPRSVLDVGCGVGTWARVWIESGVDDVVGVDGNYVDKQLLEIPEYLFVSHDLRQPLNLKRKFDLVTCFEVAEHLPADSAAILVESLTRHADVVVFSAAIPGQGGVGHINEQWPSYWARHFADCGFELHDPFRAAIWNDDSVDFWYRQNCVLFAAQKYAAQANCSPVVGPVDLVHPAQFQKERNRPFTVAARRSFGRTRLGSALRQMRDNVKSRSNDSLN